MILVIQYIWGDDMDIGIYKITNTCNGKVYVGQSIHLSRRWRTHVVCLRRGDHNNPYLQRAFDKYGASAFSFEILEYCGIDELNERERHYINLEDARNRDVGYNVLPPCSEQMLDETKDKIRLANRGNNSLLTDEQVGEIKLLYIQGASQAELAERYGIKRSTINKIVKLKNWEYIRPDLNEKILELERVWESEFSNTVARRNKTINEMFEGGMTRYEIRDSLGLEYSMVATAISDENKAAEAKKIEAVRKAVRKDFINLVPRAEIVHKYNLSQTTFKRIVRDLQEARTEKETQIVLDLRSQKVSITKIAELLGVHRTTVTEITKRALAKDNTEVSGWITKRLAATVERRE